MRSRVFLRHSVRLAPELSGRFREETPEAEFKAQNRVSASSGGRSLAFPFSSFFFLFRRSGDCALLPRRIF